MPLLVITLGGGPSWVVGHVRVTWSGIGHPFIVGGLCRGFVSTFFVGLRVVGGVAVVRSRFSSFEVGRTIGLGIFLLVVSRGRIHGNGRTTLVDVGRLSVMVGPIGEGLTSGSIFVGSCHFFFEGLVITGWYSRTYIVQGGVMSIDFVGSWFIGRGAVCTVFRFARTVKGQGVVSTSRLLREHQRKVSRVLQGGITGAVLGLGSFGTFFFGVIVFRVFG